MTRRNWWATATKEQRLVQCRAGAEAGLSAADMGVMFGDRDGHSINLFCRYHGIELVNEKTGSTIRKRLGGRARSERARMRLTFVDTRDAKPELVDENQIPVDRLIGRNL